MRIKDIVFEDFVNYKIPSMFLIFPYCNFKCCIEANNNICQNMDIINNPIHIINDEALIQLYLENPITHAIVCGGLEPLDSWAELQEFIRLFRFKSNDPIVIYTGYNKDEITDKIEWLKLYTPIIIKYGRFIPNQESKYDNLLGVNLASPNQYAEEL